MSLLAGLFSVHPDRRPPEPIRRALLDMLAATMPSSLPLVDHEACLIALAEFGAYGDSGFAPLPSGRALAVVGHPHLDLGAVDPQPRAEQIAAFAGRLDSGDQTALQRAQGTYAASFFDPAARELTLWTDKIGVRPIFYTVQDDLVTFSSALWVLEQMPSVTKTASIEGLFELGTLGYCLADRTPYIQVVRLLSGERVRFAVGQPRPDRQRYFCLEQTPTSSAPPEALAQEAARLFRQAIRRRLAGDCAAVAFLSGGLDSRVITATLREFGIRTTTYNFSLPGSLDRILAADYARVVDADHHEAPWIGGSHVTTSLASAWSSGIRPPFEVEHPRLAWSGDGGSVGLGAVYITREMVSVLGSGDTRAAVREFVHHLGASPAPRLFSSALRPRAAEVPFLSLEREFSAIQHPDPVQALYFLLMLNDQRHHLHGFFERSHIHGYDLHLPFFDGDFLQHIATVPVAERLYHRFYSRFLAEMPHHTTSVPWQTYVGHDPCPLPMPEGALQQWTNAFRAQVRKDQRGLLITDVRSLADSRARGFFNEPLLHLALWAAPLGIQRFYHAVRRAAVFHRCLRVAGNQWR